MNLRRADDRGRADFGWLDSRHSFSFGQYFDQRFMGFGPLRVINEDKVAPGRGFDTHGHRDMEIVSYVLEGALRHKDSTGTGSVIGPGDVQRMSAGTGVMHSEFNDSDSEPVHFLQIWIEPEEKGLPPSYEERHFPVTQRQDQWRLIGSRDGRDQSVVIHRDVDLFSAVLGSAAQLSYALAENRSAWLQLARGEVVLNGQTLTAGDGVAIEGAAEFDLRAATDAELLLFDMA